MTGRMYLAIDLKSFYASVECIERGLDPMTTNLVVADQSRTDKTICLAVSPSLKFYGIPGRLRLFEVKQKIREVNENRRLAAPGHLLSGSSWKAQELKASPSLAVDYLVAPPQMTLYMQYSARIYEVYLKYIAPEDIHVYSIDEVFIDVTGYLGTYQMTARDLASEILREVRKTTGITAAAGIGPNLYLAKVAMDIEAKHIQADADGVRIAQLDEQSYRRLLWCHRPLTDFWRIGQGYAKKLEEHGLFTMGDIARCSLGKYPDYYNEELLYQLFGINAELLIDHAWGWEPCTIADIKSYKPASNSMGSGQVLPCPYPFNKARLVLREMADMLSLQLVDQNLVTKQLVLTVGYAAQKSADCRRQDHLKHAHGTENLKQYTSSAKMLMMSATKLFERIVNPDLMVRRIYLTASHVINEDFHSMEDHFEQLDLFTDYSALEKQKMRESADLRRERQWQKAILDIKKKYGKNAILRGMNFEDGATARERNKQIGGHKA